MDVFAPNAAGGFDGFHMEARRARALAPLVLAIGRRQVEAPAGPAPTPATLRVFVTQPAASAMVSGAAWVVLRVEGTSGSANVFTLSADGAQVDTQISSTQGPVSLRWDTGSSANGAHTLTATVRDAAGNAGSTSLTVLVQN